MTKKIPKKGEIWVWFYNSGQREHHFLIRYILDGYVYDKPLGSSVKNCAKYSISEYIEMMKYEPKYNTPLWKLLNG